MDSFQGRERAVVIFSTTRSNDMAKLGFMADGRRLNVALTRARQAIIIVGDDLTLRAGSRHWEAYLTWLQEQRAIFGQRRQSRGASLGSKEKKQEQIAGAGKEGTKVDSGADGGSSAEDRAVQIARKLSLDNVRGACDIHLYRSNLIFVPLLTLFGSLVVIATGATQ